METVMHAPAGFRPRLGHWLESAPINNGLIALILVNAVILGLETSPSLMAAWGSWLSVADRTILAVFVVEIALRLYVHRLAYFRDPWNVFDFVVVAIALVPASGPLAVLRALRILRVLRLITLVPSMKRVVGGLLAALPGLGSVMGIICIIFYVAAVIATKLFAADLPALFGDLGSSAFTLFQVMTLEGWAMEVVRPVMAVYPASWIFFLIFILACGQLAENRKQKTENSKRELAVGYLAHCPWSPITNHPFSALISPHICGNLSTIAFFKDSLWNFVNKSFDCFTVNRFDCDTNTVYLYR